jgi:hypothetical protein
VQPAAWLSRDLLLATRRALPASLVPGRATNSQGACTAQFFEAYQAARRSFLEEVAAVIGGDVSILDIRAQKRRRAETVPSRHSIEVIGHAPVESRRP